MTVESDPPRLLEEGSDAPDALRQVLKSCREDVGTPGELEELEARLAPHLWQPGPTSGPGGGTGGALLSSALKVSALVAVTAAAAGSFWVGTRSTPPARPPVTRRVFPTFHVPAAAPKPPPLPVASAQTDDEVSSRTSVQLPRANPPIDAPSESDLLTQAQAAVARDPLKALSLTEQHARKYPHGVLSQEREVIAIEALSRLRRTTEVRARATRFLATYPDSAHRSKIESLLGSK